MPSSGPSLDANGKPVINAEPTAVGKGKGPKKRPAKVMTVDSLKGYKARPKAFPSSAGERFALPQSVDEFWTVDCMCGSIPKHYHAVHVDDKDHANGALLVLAK